MNVLGSNNQKKQNAGVSIDEDNNLIAFRVGNSIIVYDLKSYKKGKYVQLYKFNIDSSESYKQGTSIKGGYYYVYLGSPGKVMALEAYNLLGKKIYHKDFYINNKTQADKKHEEAEGLQIYNNKLYIGYTSLISKDNYDFNIGYFK